MTTKNLLNALLVDVLTEVSAGQVTLPDHLLERPRMAAHGDWACNVALQLAKSLQQKPRDIAQRIVDKIAEHPMAQALIERVDIAGPGFINIVLKLVVKQGVVKTVLLEGGAFGKSEVFSGQRVM